jgi:UDP-2,3-diacylglucosamine pyrophosphatase LpxH
LNIENELRLIGLTPELYESFLQDCADKINGVSDMDWSEIIEKYNLPFDRRRISESMGRSILGGNFVREFYKNKVLNQASDQAIKELVLKEQEIYKAKRKLQDERNELNRMLREEARHEENIRILEERLEKVGKDRYPFYLSPSSLSINSNTDTMVIMLSDLHIGLNTPTFNTDIVKVRLAQYLQQIREIVCTHNVNKCVIVTLGDLISGANHLTIQISNRENVIEQVMSACELIADFVYKLGELFNHIEFYSVPGNHSRIEKNIDDALLGDRLDNLVPWFLKHIFKHQNQQFYIGTDHQHNTYTEFKIGNQQYVAVHGDWDGINDTAVQKFCAYIGYFPYAVLMGHMHHPAMNEVSGIKVIQSGCLYDGDEYTERKRLKTQASQMVLICDDNRIKAIYPIEFK